MSKSKRRDIPVFATPLIETHCHLDYLEAAELQHTLVRARQVGVERIVTIAVSAANLDNVLALTRAAPDIWGTQGIHPHEAEGFDSAVEARIRAQAGDPRIVAIGEIGLDYYYDHLPIVVHTREADEDTRAILAEYAPHLQRKGVIHSFTSGLPLAEFCLDAGFMLGFNGITTFNSADNVRAVVTATPLDQLVLETDAPYLTPVPYRGRPNAPFYLPFIAERIAEVLEIPVETLLQAAYRNSLALFFPATGE